MRQQTPTYKLNDFSIYGSSRLGVRQENVSITLSGSSTLDLTYRELGNKRYELSNHLGNVLEVISDRKLVKEEVTRHAKFNGSGQYINLGTVSRGIVNEVTVEFMMKTTTNSSAAQAIVSDYGNPNVYGGYTVFLNQGKIEIRGRNSSDGIFKISGSNGTISVADGQWHHIAAVITPSDVWEVYIDGVLSESVNYGSTVNDLTNGVNLTIGRHYYNGLNYSGELKEVSIWNRAKSQLEIQQDRTSYFIGNETNLVSYLKLDEPTGGYQDKVTGGYYNNSPRPTSIAEGSVYYTADVISYSDYYPFTIRVIKDILIPKDILSEQEVAILFQQCEPTFEGIRNKAILSMLYGCGLRKLELHKLNVSDINMANDTVRITKGKNSWQRDIPISPSVRENIENYLYTVRNYLEKPSTPTTAFMLTNLGIRMSNETIYLKVKQIAKRSEIEKNITPHGLRHAIATHLLGELSLQEIALFLGHKSLDSTQVYTHIKYTKTPTL